MLGQKSKVDGIKLHIDLANDEMTKAEIAKAKAEKDTVKLANAIKNNKATLEELQEELEGLNQQYEECTEYVEEIRAQVEVAQTAAENSKDDLEALKAQLDEKTEEIQAFRQKEVCHKVSCSSSSRADVLFKMALKQKLTDIEKESTENSKALERWSQEHDELRLQDIE